MTATPADPLPEWWPDDLVAPVPFPAAVAPLPAAVAPFCPAGTGVAATGVVVLGVVTTDRCAWPRTAGVGTVARWPGWVDAPTGRVGVTGVGRMIEKVAVPVIVAVPSGTPPDAGKLPGVTANVAVIRPAGT
jgi:hypothetical protein